MENNIQTRSKQFAIRIIKLCSFLYNNSEVTKVLANQLLRSGTSIGANVREAQSAQSDRDFLNKLEIALKEARETEYWLELLIESEIIKKTKLESMLNEADAIVRILVTITQKLKQK